MFTAQIGMLQGLSPAFTDSDKQILASLLGNCTQALSTQGPVTFGGPVTVNNINNTDYTVTNNSYGPAGIAIVQLEADLVQGGAVDGTLCEWNPAVPSWDATGATVTVYDSANFGPASTGQRAVTCISPKSNRREIIALLSSGAGDAVLFFQVGTGGLSAGSSCTGKLLAWDGSAWTATGSDLTFYDVNSYGPASAGIQGCCIHSGSSLRYEIISLPPGTSSGSALFPVTLTADLAVGDSADCTLPDTTTVTLYDVGSYGPLPSGSIVIAQYNSTSSHYELVSANPAAWRILASLTGTLDQGSSVSATAMHWDSGLSKWSTSGGATLTLHDPGNFGPAYSGDIAVVNYSLVNDRFEIVNLPGVQNQLVKLTADCQPNSDVSCKVYTGTVGSETDSGTTITVRNRGPGYIFSGVYAIATTANAAAFYFPATLGITHLGKVGADTAKGVAATITLLKNDGTATSYTVSAPCFMGPLRENQIVLVWHNGQGWLANSAGFDTCPAVLDGFSFSDTPTDTPTADSAPLGLDSSHCLKQFPTKICT